jgi:hypothetical protein
LHFNKNKTIKKDKGEKGNNRNNNQLNSLIITFQEKINKIKGKTPSAIKTINSKGKLINIRKNIFFCSCITTSMLCMAERICLHLSLFEFKVNRRCYI